MTFEKCFWLSSDGNLMLATMSTWSPGRSTPERIWASEPLICITRYVPRSWSRTPAASSGPKRRAVTCSPM